MFWQVTSQKITLGLLWFRLLPQARHDRFSSIGLRYFIVIEYTFFDASLMSCGDDLGKKDGTEKDIQFFKSVILASDGTSEYKTSNQFIHSCNQS